MNSISSFFFLSSLTLICLTVQSHQTPATALIKKACQYSHNKALCFGVLQSQPASQNSDLKQLSFIALQAASKDAAATSLLIKKSLLFADETTIDSSVQQSLSDCGESYNSIVVLIDDSINALLSGPVDQVETQMAAAIAAVDTCAKSIKEQKGQALVVATKNHVVRQLCNTALSVYHSFVKN